LFNLVAGQLRRELQPEADVSPDGHVRVQRVVLEHHRHVSLAGTMIRDIVVAKPYRAIRHVLETGETAERCRFPAAGRSD